jgi:hypothetical protein
MGKTYKMFNEARMEGAAPRVVRMGYGTLEELRERRVNGGAKKRRIRKQRSRR